jgi:endonuclease YncB( thermonuclease family)
MEKRGEIKKEKIVYFLIYFILILTIIAILTSIPVSYDAPKIENNTVVGVIDGDTFEYYDATQNKILKVRLLCVDTPEKNEEGYAEAREYLKKLILGKEVILKSSIQDKDDYGRLLRYVYVDEFWGFSFINKLIVANGYGDVLIIPPEKCLEMK